MVMSRAGKASGKNKYWFNVKDLYDDSIKNVDSENINGWKNTNMGNSRKSSSWYFETKSQTCSPWILGFRY